MNRFSYWPYDEVSLQADFAQQQITIKTPWLEATTNCNMIEESKIRSLTRKVNAQELSEMDLELFNDFFKHFSHMPFGYILPTRKKETSLDPHLLRDQTLLTQGLREIFRKILGSPERWTCDISDGEIEEALSILPRSTWEWDSDAAISFASIHGQVNPESLFSVARRFHLLELMQSDKGNQTFLAIDALNEDEFR